MTGEYVSSVSESFAIYSTKLKTSRFFQGSWIDRRQWPRVSLPFRMTSNSPQSNVPPRNYSLRVIGGQTMTRSANLLLGAPPERTGAKARLHSWGRPCILPLLGETHQPKMPYYCILPRPKVGPGKRCSVSLPATASTRSSEEKMNCPFDHYRCLDSPDGVAWMWW